MTERADPVVNDLNRPFWDAAARGALCLPHCVDSDRAFWPPGPFSPFTAGEVAWREVVPIGTVVTLVRYQRVFQQAFAARGRYAVALVDLAGARLSVYAGEDMAFTPGDRVRIGFAVLVEGCPAVPVIASVERPA